MCILLFDVFNEFSLVKKQIDKGMSNIYYRESLTFSKPVGRINPWEKKIWKNALALISQKVQGKFVETVLVPLLSSAVFRLQKCVSDFF